MFSKISLFKGIEFSDINSVLSCINSISKDFSKGEIVLQEGDNFNKIGIVLSGRLQIIKEDYYGNRNIISNLFEGDLFGESLAFSTSNAAPITVLCSTDASVIFLDSKRIISPCEHSCTFHNTLIFNLVHIISNKNVNLNNKIDILTQHTTRDKILNFLYLESKKRNSNHFDINFNRQELADYLSVNRSALSNELSKLKKDGIIDFDKNEFVIV